MLSWLTRARPLCGRSMSMMRRMTRATMREKAAVAVGLRDPVRPSP